MNAAANTIVRYAAGVAVFTLQNNVGPRARMQRYKQMADVCRRSENPAARAGLGGFPRWSINKLGGPVPCSKLVACRIIVVSE